MHLRVFRRALPVAIAASALSAAAANAGTLTLNLSVQGAGSITGTITCEQAPPVSDDAVKTCKPWQRTNSTSDLELVTLQATPATGWRFDTWTGCAFPVGDVCKSLIPKDASWAVTQSPHAKFVDDTPPAVTFDPLVRSATKELTATVAWKASEPGVTYECGLDGDLETACTSPQVITAKEGGHKLTVIATDASGNAAKRVAQEVRLLDTGLQRGPAEGSFTSATSAEFDANRFSAHLLECSLDGVPYASCKSPILLSGLADGKHVLKARAKDGDDVDLIPATRTWTVDTAAPETTLMLEDDAPTFSFASNEPGSTFTCSLDGAVFTACTAPRPAGGLAPGSHEFAVIAIDRAGNADPTPAKRRWTVDASLPAAMPSPTPEPVAAPAPVIVAAPAKLTPGLSFRYVAGRKGTTFSRLVVTGIPAGTRLTVIVTSPHGKRRTLSSLKPLIGKRLAPGTKIAVIGKTITIRRSRAPKVA